MNRVLPAALLLVSAAAFVWFAFSASWAHPEAVGSAFIAKEFKFCKGDRWECLRYFDDHPVRVRPVSQTVELLDARLRHQLAKLSGPHPFFADFSALLSALLCPLLAWTICRRAGLTALQAAVCVSFLALSVGFLSAHLLFFRPAKHLVILFMLATAYALSKRQFPLAFLFAMLGALSDEIGLVAWLVPAAVFREEFSDGLKKHWPFVGIACITAAMALLIYKLHHVPNSQNDLPEKDWAAFTLVAFLLRTAILGAPSVLFPRLAPSILIVAAFTAAMSFIGGDPFAYELGYYYGSHMSACYMLACVRYPRWIPVLLVATMVSVMAYPHINARFAMAEPEHWLEIHR